MATSTKVSLKLLIDTKSQQVLFAEANKDFVDFLFHLLSLPVGTVVRLLSKHNMVGCLGILYHSVENLSDSFFQPNQSKDILLKPRTPTGVAQAPLLLPGDVSPPGKYFMCRDVSYHNFHFYVTDNPLALCPQCNTRMSKEVPYVAPSNATQAGKADEGGFVKGVVTYMVMDDLTVKPMSTISSITLLNKFNIKDVGSLEEKVVDLGMEQGLELLKASLQTKMVLTQVFCNKPSGKFKGAAPT